MQSATHKTPIKAPIKHPQNTHPLGSHRYMVVGLPSYFFFIAAGRWTHWRSHVQALSVIKFFLFINSNWNSVCLCFRPYLPPAYQEVNVIVKDTLVRCIKVGIKYSTVADLTGNRKVLRLPEGPNRI